MGVGRGVSPYELAFYDAEPQQSRGMFREALDLALSGLSKGEVISQESCFSPQAVRLHMQPLQRLLTNGAAERLPTLESSTR